MPTMPNANAFVQVYFENGQRTKLELSYVQLNRNIHMYA